ncbi:MAG: caspase family protein [Chitinophagaceae bacterium]
MFPKTSISFTVLLFLLFLSLSQAARGNGGFAGGTTLVLEKDQFPAAIKKLNPSKVYLLYSVTLYLPKRYEGIFLRGDTITNLKSFTDSAGRSITGFRLIYESKGNIDSVWQMDTKFRISGKAYPLANDLLHILAFDSTMQKVDEFIFNYGEKIAASATRGRSEGGTPTGLEKLLRRYEVYTSYDRNNYVVSSLWILSVGIDDYVTRKYSACKSDAISYTEFFKKQFTRKNTVAGSLVHEYVLLDKDATREAILNALKDISRKASFNDYFIFNFSGQSNSLTKDSTTYSTYFFPYDIIGSPDNPSNRDKSDKSAVFDNMISLNVLQEYIQSIRANNQLFISEAGPSKRFKTEFIKTLMQNSPEVASILNKNRVIIIPTNQGMDGVSCLGKIIEKGPINYYITSLDSGNIYNLFGTEYDANQVAFRIKNKAYSCQSFDYEYFDIFFEKKFLKDYNEIFDGENRQTRGLKPKAKDLKEAADLTGKQYALVVGTNNYTGGWKKLPNAINDARAIRDELVQGYGFDVQLLEDKPLDTIYKALSEYYRLLQPNDQLLLYFAGHGDMETEFMDDGFIVCADSKPREQDITRNSYIQYVRLQKMINKIPARQILVMLDVCHAGTFNQKRSDPVKTIPNRNVRQFLVDQSKFICRKFLSSVGTDEAFDGKPGDHSPFANLLLQVLSAKGNNSNGIVTLSSIYSVLQTASMNETATLKISPQKDGFGKDNPESDFILIPVEKTPAKE